MAVDHDLLDDIAASIADLYREVETSLVKTIADRLKEDLPLPSPFQEGKVDAVQKLRRSAQAVIATLQASKAGVIRDAVARAYRNGYATAQTDLPDLSHGGQPRLPRTSFGQGARQATEQIPNAAVVENIAQALHRDLGRVDGNILRNVLDAYRAVQAAGAARIITGTQTRRQASQAMWQRLIDKGITSFTDRAGRVWKLSSYAEMIGRSNAQRAAVQGQTDRLTSLGVDLMIVSNNSQECKVCRPFEGKILAIKGPTGKVQVEHATRDGVMVTVHVKATLDQARAAGLFHPNCRHSISAYTPGITKIPTNTADPEGDKARQRQRYLERQIRKHKERAVGALTPEAKKAANANVRTAQAALRDHLKANPKLKRLPYREQIGAGNIPGKGGPQGGPVGDLQPPTQDALDLGPAVKPEPRPARPTASASKPDVEAERVRREAQEQARREAEAAEKARAEAEAQAAWAKTVAEEKARRQAEAQATAEAERKTREEAERKAAAEAQAKAEAQAAARRAAEENAQREAKAQAKAKAEAAAKAEAERVAAEKAAAEKAAAARAAKAKLTPAPKPKTGRKPTPAEADAYKKSLAAARTGEDALESAQPYAQVIRNGVLDRRFRSREIQPMERTLVAYTTDDYVPINRSLFAAKGRNLGPDVDEGTRGHISHLDRLMAIAPTKRDMVVYRGVREPHKSFDDPSTWNPRGGNEGLEWTGHAFSSTSAREDVAEDFLTGSWGQDVAKHQGPDAKFPTLYRILVPAGTKALQLTEMHEAAEVLLDRGLRYRVVADHGIVKGLHRVDLEVIP